MYTLSPMFAVPAALAKMPDCAELNRELRELFLVKAAEGDKYRNPEPFTHRNAALFESNFRLFDWPQPCVTRLRDFCLANVYRTIRELSGYDTETLRRLHIATEAWFHVTHRGGYFGPHNHPMHSWSGVYCVCQEGDDPESDSGKLALINPHAMSTMYVDMANFRMKAPYSMANRMIRLSPGDLLIFPSWLLHEVLPYEGDGVRITVAFNARFKLEGVAPAQVPVG
ncbi:putative 2OG-Fe(II) oxygenase [Arenimonas fontis]|nr:putative 2OG-Fe(II) oxygenase [Arenimonas fontis]